MKSETSYTIYSRKELKKIQINENLLNEMLDIISSYYPLKNVFKKIAIQHIENADSLILARQKNKLVGISVSSVTKMRTPFKLYKIPVIFQRMLFLDPHSLYRKTGTLLMTHTFKQLMGHFWFLKPFVLIGRTQNPVVLKMLTRFTEYYPKPEEVLPKKIKDFVQLLLPMLHAKKLEENGCLAGSLSAFKDMDYTKIWNEYFYHKKNPFNEMVLSSAFKIKNNKIINSGSFLILLGYSKPFNFVRFSSVKI